MRARIYSVANVADYGREVYQEGADHLGQLEFGITARLEEGWTLHSVGYDSAGQPKTIVFLTPEREPERNSP